MSEKCELDKTRVRFPEALVTVAYCRVHKQTYSNCLLEEIKKLKKDAKTK